jgi:asparagine synthase (glutamine-hydrolysing)
MPHVPNQAFFGHRRLAIIDLDHGHQPMVSPNGRYTLVLNGEIYNYLELRKELSGKSVEFKTVSNTDILLAMLIYYGREVLSRLNGMFAFVFHDRQSNQ